ncbi:T9SS type A sorting domain-containing protein [Viscerimonas tarda]
MKTITSIFLSLLFCSMATLKAAEPVATIVFTDPTVATNMELSTSSSTYNENYTEKTTKGGQSCILVPSGKYAYIKVADAAVLSTDNNLLINITYFDEGSDNLKLQYNATASVNYKDQTVKKTGTNTWVTATMALTDASFRNAQNNGADFRVSATCYIREITITKGTLDPNSEPAIPVTASAFSEFKGKSVAGYQVWFATGNATSGWVHWSPGTPPKSKKVNFEIYPDVTEYDDADLAQTAFANLGNGQPAKLFNSANEGVINTHFKWMRETGIDGVAVQRFLSSISTSIVNSNQSPSNRIKRAAEANNRIFYICYDISGGKEDTWAEVVKFDWVYNVERNNDLIQSPAYAKVGNKPVVQLWGPGFTGRPGNAEQTIELVNFLQARGCYVIGGVPTDWRTLTGDSKPGYAEAYLKFDMLSPWLVGRFKDNAGANSRFNNNMKPDKTLCDAQGVDYMPVIFPGFAWSQWNPGNPNDAPRNAGEFLWNQAKNIKALGVESMYFAMFDEYDEGTAIMKAATDWSMIPTDQYFMTTSADGYWLSSDFILRTAGAAIDMLKGIRPVTPGVPVPHSEGPVYYRNSFESMTTPYNYTGDPKVAQNTGTFKVDPCFKSAGIESNVNSAGITAPSIQQNTEARSGAYLARISGTTTITADKTTKYYYRISETKIPIIPNMRLSFWKNTVDENGRYAFVDIKTKTGKNLRDNGYTTTAGESMQPGAGHGTAGAGWEHFVCEFGEGVLLGDTITNIVIGYEKAGAGALAAYFDDFLIDDGTTIIDAISSSSVENAGKVYVANGQLIVNGYPSNAVVSIYNIMGQGLRRYNYVSDEMNVDLPAGIYIVKVQYNGKTDSYKILVK